MERGEKVFRYAPRLAPEKLLRLYRGQAAGLLDEALLEDVALTLYLRCLDILAVARAKEGFYRCPYCHGKGEFTEIERRKGHAADLVCPRCGGGFSAEAFRASYKRRQLNLGGAGGFFRRYALDYGRPSSAQERMLHVDALIHGFHYSLRERPDQPSRSVGPNLLELNLSGSLAFLDALSGYATDDAQRANADHWKAERDRMLAFWPEPGGAGQEDG